MHLLIKFAFVSRKYAIVEPIEGVIPTIGFAFSTVSNEPIATYGLTNHRFDDQLSDDSRVD